METCLVCDGSLSIRWFDHHGIAACSRCGCPYRIYHYENEKRVEKPMEVLLDSDWLSFCRRYWSETKRRVVPGLYDMGVPSDGQSYSGATGDDVLRWNEWCKAHLSELPKDDSELVAQEPPL